MGKWGKRITTLLLLGFLVFKVNISTIYASNEDISYGADIGWLSQLESQGVTWLDDNGVSTDPLLLLKNKGVDAVRLRVFVKPPSDFEWIKPDGTTCILGYADTDGLLYTAQRAKELGMKVMLVFHYSDHFADPLHQDVPSEWAGATTEQLEKYLYDYTSYIMNRLANEGIYPEWVEVGNEVSYGILFPTGSNQTNDFAQLTRYLNSGYDAVKSVSPSSKVITHLTHGAGVSHYNWFFDNFITQNGGKTDVIGLSYYPYWTGENNIEQVALNLYNMASKFGKEVMICETGEEETKEGDTYNLLRKELNAIKAVPNQKGLGVFYWEPEANSSIMPDDYHLGATKVIGEKTLQFTSALDAFKTGVEYLGNECTYELMNLNSEKALNVTAGSLGNSATIEQYTYNRWSSQKWIFEKVEGNYYRIVNFNSGKVLDVKGLSTEPGAACIQHDYNGGWNQMWEIITTNDGKYKVKNRWSGLYLGISEGSEEDGAACLQISDDGSENIKWYFLVTE